MREWLSSAHDVACVVLSGSPQPTHALAELLALAYMCSSGLSTDPAEGQKIIAAARYSNGESVMSPSHLRYGRYLAVMAVTPVPSNGVPPRETPVIMGNVTVQRLTPIHLPADTSHPPR